jgi:hypothetical protein
LLGTELDVAWREREQGVILAEAHVRSGMPLGSALARDDVAGQYLLATEYLHAEPLAVGVAAVAGGAACFFVSHCFAFEILDVLLYVNR